jgi:hypothetical protein
VIREETIASPASQESSLWTVDPGQRFPYIRALYFPCFAVAARLSV